MASSHDNSTVAPPAFNTYGNAEIEMMEGFTGPPADQLLRLSGILDAAAQPGANLAVLENAAGGAVLTAKLKTQLPEGVKIKVVAGDVEKTMVDLANKRFQAAGWKDVEAQVIDGQSIPFPDESFDFSFIHFGIQLYPDPAKGLSESLRVLRRGGLLGLTTWHTPGFLPLLQAAQPSFPTPPAMLHPLAQPTTAGSALAQAGCDPSSVRVEAVRVPIPFESADAFFETMRRGMPAIVGDEGRNAKMREVIKERYGEGPFVLNWDGLAIVGTKA
ncbi:hypothetical protein JCM10450v2_002448 [Rhodotorula kratochvilovae]